MTFDPNQPRDPHTGEWVGRTLSHLRNGKVLREVTVLADHGDEVTVRANHGKAAGMEYRTAKSSLNGEPSVKVILASDLSSGDARRSRAVSPEEFAQVAARGKTKFDALRGRGFAADGLQNGERWDKVRADAYNSTRSPWGGVTVDAHTGAHVAEDADLYALTVRDPGMDPVSVSPSASREEFDRAMDEARDKYRAILRRPGSHLGVFHDQDTGRIDIDPVYVTPSLTDVEEIGAYTHAVGGAYHFQSGDGFWPPHVKDEVMEQGNRKKAGAALSVITPSFAGTFDLSVDDDGRLAFWKQILPLREIHYTAADGSRQRLDFNEPYLTDLANNKAVDKVGFLLADTNNAHTMDPERWRGDVTEFKIRDDLPNPEHNGLWGKIVFPNREAAKAVLDNPDLGVSARIREGVQKSDGSMISRGIIHVLGTLDPQVVGMAGWQTADLSMATDDVLDLSNETFEEGNKTMAFDANKPLADYTEADIAAFTEDELDSFLDAAADLFDGTLEEITAEVVTPEVTETKTKPEEVRETVSLSNEAQSQIDRANARASEALRRAAEAEWKTERETYMLAGVPPFLLDLSAPVLNRPDEFVVDLSNTDGAGVEIDVSKIVRQLLDAAQGTVDLSVENGHGGTFKTGDGEDPDKALLDLWAEQS